MIGCRALHRARGEESCECMRCNVGVVARRQCLVVVLFVIRCIVVMYDDVC